ncbi:MAG: malto-oligosyltrehalose trehalohydrolase [Chloroflexi bacterium]|nr:malto-oligosyltrehalose trehalohydrolase [Chloroflexota bacterium]
MKPGEPPPRSRPRWELPFGAQVLPEGTRFRVWAPRARRVEVELYRRSRTAHYPLSPADDGFHAGLVPGVRAGARYRYRLDGGPSYPDPCSRSQPEGPHGPSAVVDPRAVPWRDGAWPGLRADGLVIYECHVGTFTPGGTFGGVVGQLGALKRLGVTAVELLPVAEFPGRWNWGYDGVDLYAPYHGYGGPRGLRRLVDTAHRAGLGVVLDVVYNHLGPDGNYLRAYSDDYFTDRYRTPWGEAINYDGPGSRWARELVIENACYWLVEYRVDGLRLDATHAIFDRSPRHILAELAERARAAAGRPVVIIAEDHDNDVRFIRPTERGGYGLDDLWADDFHHAVRVFLTGDHEGYFRDYRGTTAEIAHAIQDGFVYQGQPSRHFGRPRGTVVTDESARAFVFCIQNHDQVGNRAHGERLSHLVDAPRYAVASAVLLLAPETPLLFMGQEFAASSPFLYFTDHVPELGRLVTAGRRDEFRHFAAFRDPVLRETIPDPQAEQTFRRSQLDMGERRRNAAVLRLYRDLLRVRRSDTVLAAQDRRRTRATALGEQIVAVHRWSGAGQRVLLANFGPPARLVSADEPFLAALPPGPWRVLLNTAARRYGGSGERVAWRGRGVTRAVALPGRCAVLCAVG